MSVHWKGMGRNFIPPGLLDASLVSLNGSDAVFSGSLTIPATILARLYWQAKSFDWTVGLAYTATSTFPINPGLVATGNLTGSGTQTIQQPDVLSSGIALTPAQRGNPRNTNFPANGYNSFGTYADACQPCDPSTGNPIGTPTTTNFPFSLDFFSAIDVVGGSGRFAIAQNGSAYRVYLSGLNRANPGPTGQSGILMLCDVGGSVPYGYAALSALYQISPEPPASASSAQIRIQATGMSDVTIPLFVGAAQDIGGYPYTLTLTGEILINFNTFWP